MLVCPVYDKSKWGLEGLTVGNSSLSSDGRSLHPLPMPGLTGCLHQICMSQVKCTVPLSPQCHTGWMSILVWKQAPLTTPFHHVFREIILLAPAPPLPAPLLLSIFKKNPFNMSFREFSLYSSGYRKKKKQWSGHLYSRRGHLYSKIWKQLKNMHNSFTSLTYQCTAVKWVIQTLLWEEITMTPKTCGRDRTQ